MFVFTGYLDESGTHGGSPATVMGGLLARAEQWKRFEDGFAKAQKRHGFRVWHSKQFRQRKGDFKGWTNGQREALFWELAQLTSYGLSDVVTMTLNNADYEKHYRGSEKPNKARLDSKYGFCFRICLYHLARQVMKRRHRKKTPHLHIVLEAGHNNYGDAERIFLEVKEEFARHGNHMLRTITKAKKDECGQLMMADFAAHGEYFLETRAPTGQRDKTPSRSVPKGMTGHTHYRSTPEELAKTRAEIIEKATRKKWPSARASSAEQSS
jgi:hypothetical protein